MDTTQQPQQQLEPIAVSVREAARLTSLSPRTITSYISQKKLRAKKLGRRTLIPISALKALVR